MYRSIWAAGNCCAGVLTEDESCCEGGTLDLCGVCTGDNTGCHFAGSFHFGVSTPLADADARAVCGSVFDALFAAGLALAQIADVDCRVQQRGGVDDASFAVQLPMEAATARALAALQLLNPRATPRCSEC